MSRSSGPARRESSLADHPFVVLVTVLAGIAGILGLLIQTGIWDPSGDDKTTPSTATTIGTGTLATFFECRDPQVSLSKGSGPSGTKITVTGQGFPPDERVEMRINAEALVPTRTDAAGGFTIDETIPGTFDAFDPPPQLTITATATPTVCFSSAPFQLTT